MIETGRSTPDTRLADANSRLALVRTRLSHDRTMLSWVRTATSLITFGFGIHQVFRLAPDRTSASPHEVAPYLFGSAMVGLGLVTLVLASLENRGTSAALDHAYPVSEGFPAAPRNFARVLAALIGVLGIGVLVIMNV